MTTSEQLSIYASQLKSLMVRSEKLDIEQKELTQEISQLQQEFVAFMTTNKILKADTESGVVSLSVGRYARIVSAEKENVFEEIRKLGEGGLIKTVESINPQTLRGWCNSRLDENLPIPKGIEIFCKEEVKLK